MSSSGVQFDEDNFNYAKPHAKPPVAHTSPGGTSGGFTAPQTSYSPTAGANETGMVRWLMNKGIAKSPLAAQGILIALVVINIIVTFIVIKYLL